jgi:hypothetical protein
VTTKFRALTFSEILFGRSILTSTISATIHDIFSALDTKNFVTQMFDLFAKLESIFFFKCTLLADLTPLGSIGLRGLFVSKRGCLKGVVVSRDLTAEGDVLRGSKIVLGRNDVKVIREEIAIVFVLVERHVYGGFL